MEKLPADFIGRGWSFPVGIDGRGRIGMSVGISDIEESIQLILLTPKGQRVMRPEFGCQIHELVFAPNDATTWGLVSYYVKDALGMWEPRIRVLNVQVNTDEQTPERLIVEIDYQVNATLDRRTLVFPYYRIPGDENR